MFKDAGRLFPVLIHIHIRSLQREIDTLLINGKILTVDEKFSVAEALAIKDGRIVIVGDNQTISALGSQSSKVVDLAGRTVIPGLIDNHMHFIFGVQTWPHQVRLDGITSRKKALDIIAAKASALEPGAWLVVEGGWWPPLFVDQPGGFTLAELDRAVPYNPFYAVSFESSVTLYLNSRALAAVGLTEKDGARHHKNKLVKQVWQGSEKSIQLWSALTNQLAEVPLQQRLQGLVDFSLALSASGLTSVYDVGRPGEGDLGLIDQLETRLPLRVWHTLRAEAVDQASAAAARDKYRQNRPRSGDEWGGLIGLGEHVYLPFYDFPGTSTHFPDSVMSVLMEQLEEVARNGYPLHEHTRSNVTISDLLVRLDKLNAQIPLAPLRWTLAHLHDFSKR